MLLLGAACDKPGAGAAGWTGTTGKEEKERNNYKGFLWCFHRRSTVRKEANMKMKVKVKVRSCLHFGLTHEVPVSVTTFSTASSLQPITV